MTKHDLINENILFAVEKQINLQNYLGNLYSWDLDLEKKSIEFKNITKQRKANIKIQILGTFSEIKKTWLWAWGNPKISEDKELIEISNSMYDLGVKENITEFTSTIINLENEIQIYEYASIASVMFDSNGFFRANYENGSTIILLTGILNDLVNIELTEKDIVKVIQKSIKYYKFDIKKAVNHYLNKKNYQIQEISPFSYVAKKENSLPIYFDIRENGQINIRLVKQDQDNSVKA